jgi:hypothetical protein
MDSFDPVRLTDTIKDSLQKLLNRDLTTLTLSSGIVFPSTITEEMVGMICNRTDLKTLYQLTSYEPIEWTAVLNYSEYIPNGREISESYQPLANNLTLFSNVAMGDNKVPFFLNANEMTSFTLTEIGKTLLTATDIESVRHDVLGLGSLATKSVIENDDIAVNTITKDKLTFTPIEKKEGFATSDIKETFNPVVQEGWINYAGTIGNANSGATYANDNAEALFKALWVRDGITVSPDKGTLADSDWSAGKKITLPPAFKLYESSYVRIKL